MTGDANLKPIMVTVATALAVTGLGRTKFVKEGRIRTRGIGRRTLVVYADLESLARSCPWWWCRSAGSLQVSGGSGRYCQAATAGSLTKGSSLKGTMVSRVM